MEKKKVRRHFTICSSSKRSIFSLPIESIPVNENGVPYFMPVIINRLLDNLTVHNEFLF